MPEFAAEYEAALSCLAEALSGLEDHAVIGGLAVAVRGVPRTTRDINVLIAVPPIRLPATLERLHDAGFTFETQEVLAELRDDHLSRIHRGSVRVDLMSAVLGVFVEVVRSARWETVQGRRVRVASAEGLALLKLIAFRPQDEADLMGLVAVNRGSLDVSRIREWYRQVGEVTDPSWRALERMLIEVEGREGRR